MAREVRVLAEPDFPKTIFVEIQTNEMSADGINEMSAQAPKKIPLKNKKSAQHKITVADQKGLEGVWGNLSSKGSPKNPHKQYLITS